MKTTKKMLCMTVIGCAAMFASSQAKAAVTDADKTFLAAAAQGDMNEIKLSELAETKASNPQVKAFAHKMVADHKMLEAKMKPFATAWGLTAPSGPDAAHQSEWDKLNGLSGADFDAEYINVMDQDHHQALDAFTTEAQTTTDAKFKAAVMQGKSVVAAHTNMADDLKGKMKM